MKNKNWLSILAIGLLSSINAMAQSGDVEMADTFRSNGKIFVVIGVIGIILVGILIFLLMIDKKVRILEKNNIKK